MEAIRKTIINTSTKKGNRTFRVSGHTWDYLDGKCVPVDYTITDCRDEYDALGTAKDRLCGYLYGWSIEAA